ncbi:uncharacterized protein Gasu_61260 [Galdieria sulphuraria]|uniref:Uncharacterized protein n=1 Tax=Galdieria sulphuraria TaxID=130081 RepID=M2X8S5_GALSU|nr:uncharacterized protein Gasu_61260 [Galdieria sulphuraria]EME26232.1 hypothetical protein Gasu_61260 [Galdieria sulphuraria]|eukprot:XP_005702752.1 hypothetical protein Gasu_61260 [Galdieria sulphuraria]
MAIFKSTQSPFGWPLLQFPHTPFPTHFPHRNFPTLSHFQFTHSSPAHNGNFPNQNCAGPFQIGHSFQIAHLLPSAEKISKKCVYWR